MIGLIITLVAVLILTVLLLLPVGGGVTYSEAGFAAWAVVGPIKVAILPAKKKEKSEKKEKPEKKKEKKESAEKSEKEKLPGGDFETLMKMISRVTREISNLKRGIRIRHMTLHFTIKSAEDPAFAAIAYGRAWAAIGIMVPILENNFVIKKREISGNVEFKGEGFKIFASAELTIRVYKILAIGLRLAWHIAMIYLAGRRKAKRKIRREEAMLKKGKARV